MIHPEMAGITRPEAIPGDYTITDADESWSRLTKGRRQLSSGGRVIGSCPLPMLPLQEKTRPSVNKGRVFPLELNGFQPAFPPFSWKP
jgi:hypothetical protein